jgi:mono/diheme cytochrome c family protein
VSFGALENQESIVAPHEASPVANRRNSLMKHACLILSLITALGVLASRTRGGPVTAYAKSATQLYSKNCASCHGRDGRSKTFKAKLNHARNISEPEWQERVSDERIFNSIMNGKGKMPAYGKKLSEQEIDVLVTYVRSLKK